MVSQSSQVKSYSDYTIVARVLSRAMFQSVTSSDITAHDFSNIDYGIIRYRIGDNGAFPIPVSEFDKIWADLQSEDVPTYEIVGTFTRGSVRVDVVSSLSEGFVETRCCWTETSLDEPVFIVQTKNGKVLRSDWKTKSISSNRWLKAYRLLWFERNAVRNSLRDTEARKLAEQEQDEINFIRSLEAAMYD